MFINVLLWLFFFGKPMNKFCCIMFVSSTLVHLPVSQILFQTKSSNKLTSCTHCISCSIMLFTLNTNQNHETWLLIDINEEEKVAPDNSLYSCKHVPPSRMSCRQISGNVLVQVQLLSGEQNNQIEDKYCQA